MFMGTFTVRVTQKAAKKYAIAMTSQAIARARLPDQKTAAAARNGEDRGAEVDGTEGDVADYAVDPLLRSDIRARVEIFHGRSYVDGERKKEARHDAEKAHPDDFKNECEMFAHLIVV